MRSGFRVAGSAYSMSEQTSAATAFVSGSLFYVILFLVPSIALQRSWLRPRWQWQSWTLPVSLFLSLQFSGTRCHGLRVKFPYRWSQKILGATTSLDNAAFCRRLCKVQLAYDLSAAEEEFDVCGARKKCDIPFTSIVSPTRCRLGSNSNTVLISYCSQSVQFWDF